MTPEPVAVVGPGRINRGIAQAFLWAGHPVSFVDLKPRCGDEQARVQALVTEEIDRGLAMLARLNRIDEWEATDIRARLHIYAADEADRPLAEARMIIEGVPEDLAIKQSVLGRIGEANADAIITSATSTIVADELAKFVSRPERFLNAHFLNPAWLIPLVELSPSNLTSEAVYSATHQILVAIGKYPVRCASSPGFIVPRVQMLAGNEAIKLLQEGVASAEDIDLALRIGFAIRFAVLGFLEFSDWGGLDIAKAAGNYLADRLGGDHYRAPPVVDEMLSRGAKGMYAGHGFFDYEGRDLQAYREGVTERLLELVDHMGLFPAPGCAGGRAS